MRKYLNLLNVRRIFSLSKKVDTEVKNIVTENRLDIDFNKVMKRSVKIYNQRHSKKIFTDDF